MQRQKTDLLIVVYKFIINANYDTISQKQDHHIKPITIPAYTDTANDVCQTNNSTDEATVKSLVNTYKALEKTKSEEVELTFPNLRDVNKIEFLCFADASLGPFVLKKTRDMHGYLGRTKKLFEW